MASTSSVPVPIVNVSHGEKPEKFNGTDFKRWQQKMFFYLTTLSLAKFFREDPPELVEGRFHSAAVESWKNSDFSCRNYILNGLDNTLYNVYCTIESAKAL